MVMHPDCITDHEKWPDAQETAVVAYLRHLVVTGNERQIAKVIEAAEAAKAKAVAINVAERATQALDLALTHMRSD